MGILDTLGIADVQEEVQEDRLGGGSSFHATSGVYDFTIEVAYLGKSKGGANSLTIHLKNDQYTLRQTLWLTSGTAKGGKNWFTDSEGNRKNLPDYNTANTICRVVLDKPFGQLLDPETKNIKLYNYDAKGEVPTDVPMIMELVGQPVTLGIREIHENKNVLQGDEYVPGIEADGSPSIRKVNDINAVFRAQDGLTVQEIQAGLTTSDFKGKWADRNTGVVVDRVKPVKGIAPPVMQQTSAPAAQAGSIFG